MNEPRHSINSHKNNIESDEESHDTIDKIMQDIIILRDGNAAGLMEARQ